MSTTHRTRINARDLASRVDLRQLVEERYGPGKRQGKAVKYRSPWRDDGRKGSFVVYANGFQDFGGSGERGDVFAWIMREYGLSFNDACNWLAQRVNGTSAPTQPRIQQCANESPSEPPSLDWQTPALQALEKAERYLWGIEGKKVRLYLNSRGITDDITRRWRLGYNPTWTPVDWWYTDDRGKQWRASLPPGIVIPYIVAGALWALRVRTRTGKVAEYLGREDEQGRDGDPLSKYLNLRGSKLGALYNGDAIQPGLDILIVEGEFDVMVAQEALGSNAAVVTLGGASTTLHARWRELIKRGQDVYLSLDNDEAGQKAAAKLREALGKTIPLKLPAGKDVTEYVTEHQGNLLHWWTCRHPGVPDSWRRALLNLEGNEEEEGCEKRGPVGALMWEVLYTGIQQRQIDPANFTMSDVLALILAQGRGIDPGVARRGVEALDGLLLEELFSLFDTDNPIENTVSKSEKKSRGRPTRRWRVLPPEEQKRRLMDALKDIVYQQSYSVEEYRDKYSGKTELSGIVAPFNARIIESVLGIEGEAAETLARELNEARAAVKGNESPERARKRYSEVRNSLDDTTSTPLPEGWTIRTLQLYRVAVLRAWKLAGLPNLNSLRQIANALGVVKDSVNSYLNRAGVIIERHQYREVPLTSPTKVEQQVNRLARFQVKGRPMQFIAETTDGKRIEAQYSKANAQGFVAHHLAAGARVSVVFQVANKHTVDLAARPAIERPEETKQTAVEATERVAPRIRRLPPVSARRSAYSPVWFTRQLKLSLERMGWKEDEAQGGHYVNKSLGERAPDNPSMRDLVELLVGHPISTGDPLLDFARSIGAVVQRIG